MGCALRMWPSNFFEKSLDEVNPQRFCLNSFPNRELFESYFVRLIGTPNQNSKSCRFSGSNVSSS